MTVQVGDLVARTSYHCDLPFRVVAIHEETKSAELNGHDVRLYADAPLDDLVPVTEDEREQYEKMTSSKEDESYKLFRQDYKQMKMKHGYTATNGYRDQTSYFEMPGRVLHIDGDPYYLKKCLTFYKKLHVPVIGKYIPESEMPDLAPRLVAQIRPDILVLTGHDAFMKNKGTASDLKAYRNSSFFIRTVKEIRYHWPSLDQMVIFSGACQSHFEYLIRAGANFASSPDRINIHALDPVYLAARISFTSFMDRVNVWDVLKNTLTGAGGLGGVESRGMLRTGLPFPSE
ncbi:sporulation peptidase YabG [Sporolactobacillus terrae]|uniref:Sporulation peptidase YabG n=1 Tax=Sporolactobacillus terrae TaxID=269673 RepID=A0A410D549_9BACL|nr:sporulation peptidase YabG [Sporolactobacillus terrae]QAA21211.1 sporulation peptidase YabG [Sporolactobacillus terrae]QAA24183.1 sporulation peptidase YabG [Sporolactobacillus terrae]UAK15993.1 sporulation peptidase YabG [Sporolactobacillus terrae]BBN97350.1 sporulation peptidase YabG [Sporolactobacillus terrae]